MVGIPAAAPILEALNAGALDVGYTGDLSFLTCVRRGRTIKARRWRRRPYTRLFHVASIRNWPSRRAFRPGRLPSNPRRS